MIQKSENTNVEKQLKGKAALISGGASGIGRAVAVLFAQEGADVGILDIDDEGSISVTKNINDSGESAFCIKGDVSIASDCAVAVRTMLSTFGSINILVNCAGIIYRSLTEELEEEEWDRIMNVNAKSVFLLCKYVIPIMKKDGGGSIINIASGWGLAGGRLASSYCASKGAVVLMTKAMAMDHGYDQIRINCICPGDIDTPMLETEASQLSVPVDLFREDATNRPLSRIGKPESIAHAALFLAGSKSDFITGASFVVDGGGLAGYYNKSIIA